MLFLNVAIVVVVVDCDSFRLLIAHTLSSLLHLSISFLLGKHILNDERANAFVHFLPPLHRNVFLSLFSSFFEYVPSALQCDFNIFHCGTVLQTCESVIILRFPFPFAFLFSFEVIWKISHFQVLTFIAWLFCLIYQISKWKQNNEHYS